MMEIKFSRRYLKLMNSPYSYCKTLKLIDVINIKLEDLSDEFIDYDTDGGLFKLPNKGEYMMLIFLKDNNINGPHLMTTLRRRTPDKEKYYRESTGKWFDVAFVDQEVK